MKRLMLGVLIIVVFSGWTTLADMRIWTDQKGNSIEAEFINIIGDKVVLRSDERGVIQVPINGLCIADKKYLASNIPPKIKLDVRVLKDNKHLGSYSDYKEETVFCKIIITKTNQEPCDKNFVVHVYLFFKNVGSNGLIAKDINTFSFDFSADSKVEFSTSPVKVEHYRSAYENYKCGEKYDGYLVFIKDAQGNLICSKGSSLLYEKNISQIEVAKQGARFDAKLNPVKAK